MNQAFDYPDVTHENYNDVIKNINPLLVDLDLMSIIPHRYPFLLVDKIILIDDGRGYLAAVKNVTNNEPFFNGHFPGFPIMPGVLVLEAAAQASAMYALRFVLNGNRNTHDVRFVSINCAKFRKPVFPGDRLYMNCFLDKRKADIFKFHARVYTEQGLCAEMDCMAAITQKKDA